MYHREGDVGARRRARCFCRFYRAVAGYAFDDAVLIQQVTQPDDHCAEEPASVLILSNLLAGDGHANGVCCETAIMVTAELVTVTREKSVHA